MASTDQHYEQLLAPIYEWMAGGAEAALTAGAADLEGLLHSPGLCLDLGAGFGMHAIPLAQAGFEVIAIDSSAQLLARLQELAGSLPIQSVCADLLDFPEHLPAGRKPSLIVCMGDTLTHLDSLEAVDRLASLAAEHLAPGGRFLATFRDYSQPLQGDRRFIPVRSDQSRILTCFLEEQGDRICVHDILHERQGDQWTMQVNHYLQLRLAPETVRQIFVDKGFMTQIEAVPRGMLRLISDRH
ncbi:class I SAM-dependent methyltransferase [Synechococcus elongatus]|uniref:Methyltransferase domain-containing protein n=1 Tax=Synechococcus elongatus (strain ATCC 33912 / PCC 7942 / FACHB-805) TaxID=1140 RepID=Q31RV5_SYNE7|nr:class I SAM-dependent methyltransferase [Synechococcus elongatus]ABB56214.1 hypothetical protein Synpcc7942_0182 [Synechococcus elongatus PCC 7942 = FACHB-805]AJD56735.1 hypothetical protein M744_02145 [Synechococcus elongatus UTEX 2973]MBD2588046.1 class I SAM-dependent methyltransferase [Synechococcus elongatus FACHB-242]MBD2689114.1 class I SAM-dependent methyltransferase [Synechococcus elongatus FACHB-1061]MBD2707246.1 class I SAM-dependent methyltransferase [Synechococcus elongatus PCC